MGEIEIEGLANVVVGNKMLAIGGDNPTISGLVRDFPESDWMPAVEFGDMLAQAVDWLYH